PTRDAPRGGALADARGRRPHADGGGGRRAHGGLHVVPRRPRLRYAVRRGRGVYRVPRRSPHAQLRGLRARAALPRRPERSSRRVVRHLSPAAGSRSGADTRRSQSKSQPASQREDGARRLHELSRARIHARRARRRSVDPRELRRAAESTREESRDGRGPRRTLSPNEKENIMRRSRSHVLKGIVAALSMAACGKSDGAGGVTPQKMADALHAVMSADRTVYTRQV